MVACGDVPPLLVVIGVVLLYIGGDLLSRWLMKCHLILIIRKACPLISLVYGKAYINNKMDQYALPLGHFNTYCPVILICWWLFYFRYLFTCYCVWKEQGQTSWIYVFFHYYIMANIMASGPNLTLPFSGFEKWITDFTYCLFLFKMLALLKSYSCYIDGFYYWPGTSIQIRKPDWSQKT